jgi:arylsulfatase
MEYFPGVTGLPDSAAPPMLNKSWTITAEVDLHDDKTEGMIVTHGGLEGGYGLYMREGKPVFVYNYLSIERPTFVSKAALPKGRATIVVDFAYDGGGMGKGGRITMTANGQKVAEGRLERTVPIKFSIGEGLDIATDNGSPVDFTYSMPFKFTGDVKKVTIELRPAREATAAPKGQPKAA